MNLIFESSKKFIIVENDEKQKSTILSHEECLKIKKLANSINKALIIIKFNSGVVHHNDVILEIPIANRIAFLHNFISNELKTVPEFYNITLVQMFFDSNKLVYKNIVNSDITVLAAM